MPAGDIKTLAQVLDGLPDNTLRLIAPINSREIALLAIGKIDTRDPTILDDKDNSAGAGWFDAGSWWLNTANGTTWRCFNGQHHLADWRQLFPAVVAVYSADEVTLHLASNVFSIKLAGVSNPYLANMPAQTIKGNNTGGAATPIDLTPLQVVLMLPPATTLVQGVVSTAAQTFGGRKRFNDEAGIGVDPVANVGLSIAGYTLSVSALGPIQCGSYMRVLASTGLTALVGGLSGSGSADEAVLTGGDVSNPLLLRFNPTNDRLILQKSSTAKYAVLRGGSVVQEGADATVAGLLFYGGLYCGGAFTGVTSVTAGAGLTGGGGGAVTLALVALGVAGTYGKVTVDTYGRVTAGGTNDVPNGGTGATTLTNHGILLGQGTAAIAATAALTNGQLLIGQTSADPLPKTLSGDATLSAAGALTLASTIAAGGPTGDSTHTAQITYDAKGRLTAVTSVAIAFPASSLPRSYLAGLTTSVASTTTQTLSIAAGVCRDDTNAQDITLAATSKVMQTSGSWSAGSGGNGIDTGTVGTAGVWYAVYAIAKADGTADVLIVLGNNSPVMPTGYTVKRRIAYIRTIGSASASTNYIQAFRQTGDRFEWNQALTETNWNPATITTTSSTLGLSYVPPQASGTLAILNIAMFHASQSAIVWITNPGDIDNAPTAASPVGATIRNPTVNSRFLMGYILITTDSSAQLRARSNFSATSVDLASQGWYDRRGRDD